MTLIRHTEGPTVPRKTLSCYLHILETPQHSPNATSTFTSSWVSLTIRLCTDGRIIVPLSLVASCNVHYHGRLHSQAAAHTHTATHRLTSFVTCLRNFGPPLPHPTLPYPPTRHSDQPTFHTSSLPVFPEGALKSPSRRAPLSPPPDHSSMPSAALLSSTSAVDTHVKLDCSEENTAKSSSFNVIDFFFSPRRALPWATVIASCGVCACAR